MLFNCLNTALFELKLEMYRLNDDFVKYRQVGWEGWHENLNENFAKKVVSHNCLHIKV